MTIPTTTQTTDFYTPVTTFENPSVPISNTPGLEPIFSNVVRLSPMYVRTASVQGVLEYGKAHVNLTCPSSANVVIKVSKSPFENLAAIFSDMPIRLNPQLDQRMLQASYAIYPSDHRQEVRNVSVLVLLPCSLQSSISLYGVKALCKAAFPNIDYEASKLNVYDGQKLWRLDRALNPLEYFSVKYLNNFSSTIY